MKVLILVSVMLCAASAAEQTYTKFPFCKIAICQFTNQSGVQMADVSSTQEKKLQIINKNFWMNTTTNVSYAYRSVTFQNNKFIALNFTFPPSSLSYMNLAFNDIYHLGKGVFKNLQNMTTLILSNNDLENIHPDAFEVGRLG